MLKKFILLAMIWFLALTIAVLLLFLGVSFCIAKGNAEAIFFINRKTGKKEKEAIPGEFWIKWLYSTFCGKAILSAVIKKVFISRLYGFLTDLPSSSKKIQPFIDAYKINMNESIKNVDEFESFNDFFVRQLKPNVRSIDENHLSVISPADGKISVFENVSQINSIFVKGEELNLASFFDASDYVKCFIDSTMAIIRLAPVDYHRFHFPVSGKILDMQKIDGVLFSVSPLAIKKNIKIFVANKREITIFETSLGNKIAMCEVGATMVGSIVQTFDDKNEFTKGDEKGYFKFGGSTVILFFEKESVVFDNDIISNTKNGFETSIKFGERIAMLKGDY